MRTSSAPGADYLALLVGKPIAEAQDWVRLDGYVIRVVRVDGYPTIGTCDVRYDRINVEVSQGTIVAVRGVG